ncbi:MAG: VOC family protein [Solirubrobacteraceae bacterium]|jgi:methylmalonyl-CoA/ethylmalonyl-CoA epimerase
MTAIRRLDHVAIAVRDTEAALARLESGYGLSVICSEEIERPHVRLTYVDCGNAFIQLVEPLDEAGPIAEFLAENGEGLHHICFGVDDVAAGAAALSPEGSPPPAVGSGRGRPSAFVAGDPPCGVRVEVTEFHRDEDVIRSSGWIPPSGSS